jgi:predicted molibdopterin-dependent oxidoreductase YjgC
MVVASPDFINIEEYAALTLRHKPGTEGALVNGLIHILLEKGLPDKSAIQKFPNGFNKAKPIIAQYTPERVSKLTEVPSDRLYAAADILASQHPMSVLSGIGISNSEAIHALANLQLLLGNLGVAGGGINPLRAQNNAQGSRDMGCMPEYLPGYQHVGDASVRQRFEQAWGGTIRPEAGMNAAMMIGNVRALYIAGEDILKTSTEAEEYRRKLDRCDFVVLQEIALSETTRYADVVLPGVSFAEKTGTFTSTERRVQMVQQAIMPIGDSRADWQIFADLGKRLGFGWEYASTAQIMSEIAALIPVYGGIAHERLERGERLQWPVESLEHAGTAILPLGLFSHGDVQWSVASAIE